MNRPPIWVILSLRHAIDADAVVQAAAKLGVVIHATSDGLQLPGGFLAWLEPEPFPEQFVDWSLAADDVALGPMSLLISGGTNELERGQHQQPTELRAAARDAAERYKAMGVLPGEQADASIESAASKKVKRLTRLVVDLTPLATALILPRANNIALDAAEFRSRAAEYLEESGYHFPLWAYLKVRPDEGAEQLVSTGMWIFGLPDVAMPLASGGENRPFVEAVGAVQREMVAEGWWPEDGAELATDAGALRLDRVSDAIWAEPAQWSGSPALVASRATFARSRAMALVVGEQLHHRTPAREGLPAIEHFLFRDGESMAITNGLSGGPQPGATPEDENQCVELYLQSKDLGPWADFWLHWGAMSLFGHGPEYPIRPYERLVLDAPRDGIAGVIVWPAGHLNPFGKAGPRIILWDMLPIFPHELAQFRADPSVHGRWLDEREARNDFAVIHERWRV